MAFPHPLLSTYSDAHRAWLKLGFDLTSTWLRLVIKGSNTVVSFEDCLLALKNRQFPFVTADRMCLMRLAESTILLPIVTL